MRHASMGKASPSAGGDEVTLLQGYILRISLRSGDVVEGRGGSCRTVRGCHVNVHRLASSFWGNGIQGRCNLGWWSRRSGDVSI